MSLVSGPGRGGSAQLPDELILCIDKHVKYIQSLDTVSDFEDRQQYEGLTSGSGKMSSSIG